MNKLLKPDARIEITIHGTHLHGEVYSYLTFEWVGGSIAEIFIGNPIYGHTKLPKKGEVIRLGLFLPVRVIETQFLFCFIMIYLVGVTMIRIPNPFQFGPLASIPIIADVNITAEKKYCRERKRSFWRKVWDSLWDHTLPWPYTPVEFHTQQVPTIMYDSVRNIIYCHPSLKNEITAQFESKKYHAKNF